VTVPVSVPVSGPVSVPVSGPVSVPDSGPVSGLGHSGHTTTRADRDSTDAYRETPYHDGTAGFCTEYDQVAFEPAYRGEPLERDVLLIDHLLMCRSALTARPDG
jgi:hypothetical protein